MLFLKTKQKTEDGFALLITLIVVSVVISIGLTLLDLTIKQLRLANGSKDSETAFHAANAGVECARFWRRSEQDKFETGANVTLNCFNAGDLTVVPRDRGTGISEYDFSFTSGTANDRCSKVKVITLSSDPDAAASVVLAGMQTILPGYPDASKSCQPGGRCTIISSQGYNKPCNSISIIGTVQREVLLEL